jgi:hypothetical protein
MSQLEQDRRIVVETEARMACWLCWRVRGARQRGWFLTPEEVESARSAGQKRRVRQPRSGQAGTPDLLPAGSKP